MHTYNLFFINMRGFFSLLRIRFFPAVKYLSGNLQKSAYLSYISDLSYIIENPQLSPDITLHLRHLTTTRLSLHR